MQITQTPDINIMRTTIINNSMTVFSVSAWSLKYFFVVTLRNNTEIKSSISLMKSLEKISHDIIQKEIVSEKPKIG